MLCERCKMREANIRFTEVVNGVVSEHNLCSHCAKELDFGQYLGIGLSGLFDSDNQVSRVLSQLLGVGGRETEENEEEMANLVCPTCHTSYQDFVKDSRFGCPDCYHMFDLLISDKLKQLHGSDTHTGKNARTAKPEGEEEDVLEKPLSLEEQISLLRSRLSEAVKTEDYESAAMLRDQIHALEKELQESMTQERGPAEAEEASSGEITAEGDGFDDDGKVV